MSLMMVRVGGVVTPHQYPEPPQSGSDGEDAAAQVRSLLNTHCQIVIIATRLIRHGIFSRHW